MRVFLTGATGFIGSNLVPELTGAGHDVVGLARSEASAAWLLAAGTEVVRGDVNDAAALRAGVARADAAIHAAFEHDFADLARLSEADRRVVATLGEALAGRQFIVTSGTGLVRARGGRPAAETDAHATSAEHPRAATEEAADALIAAGGHVVVLRLSQVSIAACRSKRSPRSKALRFVDLRRDLAMLHAADVIRSAQISWRKP